MRIFIIGGGLSGLTLSYLLKKKNIQSTVLEASSRLGGRIQTIKGVLGTPLELGATWFSDMHPNLKALLDELGLQKYPQYSKGVSLFQTKSFEPTQKFFIPEAENPSYRIAGGTQMIIEKLSKQLNTKDIRLNTKVTAIVENENSILIETSDGQKFYADKVILSFPSQLIGLQIKFLPELPINIAKILPTVQTWMSGAIKFVIEYEKPFWRNDNYSGMLFSHAGIVTEMYDHTNFEENKFGFTGFLNGSSSSFSQEVRKELVLRQLAEILGNEILQPINYFDKVWSDEYISGGNQIIHRPHQNNGHPLLQQNYMSGKLLISGTETATEFSGYMEGAIISAKRNFENILK